MELTALKQTLQWLFVHPQCCATITSISLQNIPIPADDPLAVTLPSPHPWRPPVYTLRIWISLFSTSQTNAITRHVTFRVCLLPFPSHVVSKARPWWSRDP